MNKLEFILDEIADKSISVEVEQLSWANLHQTEEEELRANLCLDMRDINDDIELIYECRPENEVRDGCVYVHAHAPCCGDLYDGVYETVLMDHSVELAEHIAKQLVITEPIDCPLDWTEFDKINNEIIISFKVPLQPLLQNAQRRQKLAAVVLRWKWVKDQASNTRVWHDTCSFCKDAKGRKLLHKKDVLIAFSCDYCLCPKDLCNYDGGLVHAAEELPNFESSLLCDFPTETYEEIRRRLIELAETEIAVEPFGETVNITITTPHDQFQWEDLSEETVERLHQEILDRFGVWVNIPITLNRYSDFDAKKVIFAQTDEVTMDMLAGLNENDLDCVESQIITVIEDEYAQCGLSPDVVPVKGKMYEFTDGFLSCLFEIRL